MTIVRFKWTNGKTREVPCDGTPAMGEIVKLDGERFVVVDKIWEQARKNGTMRPTVLLGRNVG